MPIPPHHQGRYAYHFSHIDNLPGLLRTGFLSNHHPDFPTHSHRSIAAAEIQARRAAMVVTCSPGGSVHDYVPLYFGARSPMLLGVINAKNVDQMDILYFEFPIDLVRRANVVFTNASANTAIPPDFYGTPADLDRLNWAAIDSKSWGNPDEIFRHQRMAELLVHNHLEILDATRCVVWNEDTKARVKRIVSEAGVPFPPVEFESRSRYHWFTNFQENKKSSVVAGPREIAIVYRATCEEIAKERGKYAVTAPFKNMRELLTNLRADFSCLSHTAELVGLKSENGVHKRTVDIHTQEVVNKLLTLDEYDLLDDDQKHLVQLGAYLHDIGKGPCSRWVSNGGLQKVDPNHPVGAMEMMVDILTKQTGNISQTSTEILTKLVCYHDLVGDVLGHGRDEQQIVDVVSDEGELNMLFALCRADVTALVPLWWDEDEANDLHDRCLAAIEARESV